ncbi:LysR family transcriptional regulator substrate-binding protein [Streptomyces sp. NPDC058287]|uniref:LysR family transcriptional regulator substrate-binding protein n=1 Tax=unclassified Streptomyces TaxID=2593676 RepID=UPI0036E0B332
MGLARQSELQVWFAAELAARELPPLNVVVETAHRDAIIPLILSGVGLAVLPEPEARAAERLGAVVRTVDFTVPRTCYLLHRREPLSPAAQAFVEMTLEEVPDQSGESPGTAP